MVTNAGSLLAIITAVATGTTRSHTLISNRPLIASWQAARCPLSTAVCDNPATKNTDKAIRNDGMVVIIIYLICANRFTLHTLDASTVVSDSGEILSPK